MTDLVKLRQEQMVAVCLNRISMFFIINTLWLNA